MTENTVVDFVPDTEPVVVVDQGVAELDSAELRNEVIKARDNIDDNYQRLCQLLYTVRLKRSYESWGYESFKEYVASEVVFKITKAQYLCQIWESLYVKQGNPAVYEKVMSIGWTKAKELVHIVTEENVDEWIEKAKHMSVEQLIKEKKKYLKEMIPDDPSEALGKEGDVEGTPAEDATKTANFTFSFQDYMTLSQALDRVKAAHPGIPNGAALACICQDYLGSNNFNQEGKEYGVEVIKKYEPLFGLKTVILDSENNDVLHGFDYLKELAGE